MLRNHNERGVMVLPEKEKTRVRTHCNEIRKKNI